MSQNWPTIAADGSGEILLDLASILSRFDSIRSSFSGNSAPASPSLHQVYKNTLDGKWYVCTAVGPDTWVEFLPFLETDGGTLTGALNLAKGADIPSAGTVDLDAATGNMVHVTGTTGITAITLASGSWRLIVFDAALTITLGSTLKADFGSATSITTAADDVALAFGDGSATRLLFIRKSGAPNSALLKAIAELDSSAGLIYQSGAGAVSKKAIGVAASTDLLSRADGDGRYAALSTLLAAIAASATTGLIEQTSSTTVAKRTIGVSSSSDIPSRGDADGRYLKQGSFNLPLVPGRLNPRASNGCDAVTVLETTTNKINRDALGFDADTIQYAQAGFALPKSYSGGTILARYHWEAPSVSSGAVIWGAQGVCVADGESIDASFGTAVETTDSVTGSGKKMTSIWSDAITLAGTPAGGEMLYLQVYRKASDVGDTCLGKAYLIQVDLLIPINAGDDS